MIAVIVINYRQTAVTLACLQSLDAHAETDFHLFLVDNAADDRSHAALTGWIASRAADPSEITFLSNADNLGFAGGCNQALDIILADERFNAVALLNNDTLIEPGWLLNLSAPLDPSRRIGMVAGRMMDLAHPERIDSLGIVFYRSGIASNRKDMRTPLLGPCGGAALYSADLLRAVRAIDGAVFDPAFFCYAEDTDLALRARALGYTCAFADDAVLRHHGSLSSGGGFNEFVAYQGLRNSLFALLKSLPAGFLWRNLGWILLMQCAVTVKYLIKGKPGLVWRIYRDLIRGLPRVLRQRRRIQAAMIAPRDDWQRWTCLRFYDRAYVRHGLRTLHRRDILAAHPVSGEADQRSDAHQDWQAPSSGAGR